MRTHGSFRFQSRFSTKWKSTHREKSFRGGGKVGMYNRSLRAFFSIDAAFALLMVALAFILFSLLASSAAAFALTLLLIAATALPAFSQPKNSAPDFFLCSDAALALVRGGAFADGSLQAKVDEMHSLSAMCIRAESASFQPVSSCTSQPKEATAFSLPVWSSGMPSGSVQKVRVYCWREN